MGWACMAVNGTGSLLFIDNVTARRGIRINYGVYNVIFSAHTQPNASKLL